MGDFIVKKLTNIYKFICIHQNQSTTALDFSEQFSRMFYVATAEISPYLPSLPPKTKSNKSPAHQAICFEGLYSPLITV